MFPKIEYKKTNLNCFYIQSAQRIWGWLSENLNLSENVLWAAPQGSRMLSTIIDDSLKMMKLAVKNVPDHDRLFMELVGLI